MFLIGLVSMFDTDSLSVSRGWPRRHVKVVADGGYVFPQLEVANMPSGVQVGDLPEGKGIVLIGGVGVGKTQLLVARAAMFPHVGKYYAVLSDFLDLERRGDYTLTDKVRNASYLVLDDVGLNGLSDWGLERLTTLVDGFYTRGAVLDVATNLPMDRLKGFVGDRVFSRLAEMCVSCVLSGADRCLSD